MRGKRFIVIITALALIICISACGKTVGGYQVVDAGLGERRFSICCREGDPLMDFLIAALQVCKADGTTARLSAAWFGSDLTALRCGDAGGACAPARL